MKEMLVSNAMMKLVEQHKKLFKLSEKELEWICDNPENAMLTLIDGVKRLPNLMLTKSMMGEIDLSDALVDLRSIQDSYNDLGVELDPEVVMAILSPEFEASLAKAREIATDGKINLVLVNTDEFGVTELDIEYVKNELRRYGLEICPACVAPSLIRNLIDEGNSEYFLVAMDEIKISEGKKAIFRYEGDINDSTKKLGMINTNFEAPSENIPITFRGPINFLCVLP